MDKVRIGFVGVGQMGQMAHLRNYVQIDDCDVVAIAEPRTAMAKLVAERYGVAKVYRDHREMLEAETLDGVIASQPFDRHAVLLPDIYERVKHVFTEKPLAVMPETGAALATAAAAADCTHMLGYHKRSDPATIAAKETVERWRTNGHVGRLRYVRITMPPGDWVAGGCAGLLNAGDEPPGDLPREPKPADMDEEVHRLHVEFVNVYIHQVNLLRHLLGEDYEVRHADRSGVLLVAESVSGITCAIEMAPYHTTITWEETALVGFERGYVQLALPAPLATNRAGHLETYEDPGEDQTPRRVQPEMPWVHAMRQQAINFIRVCRGEMDPPCNAAEAVKDLQTARDYIRLRCGA